MKKITFMVFSLCFSCIVSNAWAQGVAINTTHLPADNSAMLDVESTTKGVLIPRMTEAQRDNNIPSPATGLMIFQTDNTPGFYYYSGTGWALIGSGAFAIDDLFDGISDGSSVFLGSGAGAIDNGTDNQNVAVGIDALNANINGYYNTATGYRALYSNTNGIMNTATGSWALSANTGYDNTATGSWALSANTSGIYNTANGVNALYSNTIGNYNTANGSNALCLNTTGYYNTANGYEALYYNTTGYYNTANGTEALYYNTTGWANTAIGYMTGGYSLQTGDSNVLIGYEAGYYETGSNRLYISTEKGTDLATCKANALIYGEFDNDLLKFNGMVELANGTSASSLKFYEPAGFGTNFTKFQSQAQAGDVTYTLPAADGANGQFFQTNGSGMLSWATANGDFSNGGEAGGTDRTLGNTDNYALGFITNNQTRIHIKNDGKVGIGTTTPAGILDIAGAYHFPSTDGSNGQVLQTNGSGMLSWAIANGDFSNGGEAVGADRTLGNTDSYALGLLTNNTTRIHIENDGDVGIGTISPQEKLHVEGGTYISDQLSVGGTQVNMKTFISHDRYHLGLTETDGGTDEKNWCIQANNDQFTIQGVTDDWGGWNTNFFLNRNGAGIDRAGFLVQKFGFGDAAPDAVVELSGNGGADDLLMISSDDNNDGDLLIVKNDGNVGIGDSSPTAKLDVNGTNGYNQLRLRTSYTPTGTFDTNGNVGDIAWDNGAIYIKTSVGWKRSWLSTF